MQDFAVYPAPFIIAYRKVQYAPVIIVLVFFVFFRKANL